MPADSGLDAVPDAVSDAGPDTAPDSGSHGLPRGVRLGVDLGTVRIGVAASDPDGVIATPVRTVARVAVQTDLDAPTADLIELAAITAEQSARVVYVGLPRHLSGAESAASGSVRAYCGALAHAIAPIRVRLVDERLSTVAAHQALHASGRPGRRHRAVVDQAAAVVILQSAIDAERATGARVGEQVLPEEGAGQVRPVRRDDGRGGES